MKRTTIGIVVVLLATLLGAYGLVQLGDSASLVSTTLAAENGIVSLQRQGTITVSGVGEVKADPDSALVQFGIENKAVTAKEAQEANNAVMAKIIDELVRMGIKKEDIQTEYFSLYPEYNYDRENGTQTLVGYRAVNEVRVQVKDIASLGEVIDAAINAGANRIQNVTYGIQDDTEFSHEAMKLAIQNAMEKARVMAEAAGAKIGGILSLSDSGVHAGGVQLFGEQLKTMRADTSAALAPGQVTVTSQVQMVFWLE